MLVLVFFQINGIWLDFFLSNVTTFKQFRVQMLLGATVYYILYILYVYYIRINCLHAVCWTEKVVMYGRDPHAKEKKDRQL